MFEIKMFIFGILIWAFFLTFCIPFYRLHLKKKEEWGNLRA
jgi:hypothetical protein